MRLVAALALGACGRIHFDPVGEAGIDGGFAPSRITYFKADNVAVNEQFGYDLALSADGSTLAVGTPNEAGGVGAVFVFDKSGGTWSYDTALRTGDVQAVQAGLSVAISADGNTIVAGAPLEGSIANSSGAAVVFRRSGTTWTREATLKASNATAGDELGWDVAVSADGRIVAAGAPLEDTGASTSGAAYVFRDLGGGTWTQDVYLKQSVATLNSSFGIAIALSSDGATLLVGGDLNTTGAADVFVHGATWTPQAHLVANNAEVNDNFGFSVALSADGNLAGIGAVTEASASRGIDGDGTDNSAASSGAAYLFARAGMTWTQRAYVKASNSDPSDQFGMSVALSSDGDTFVVGAIDDASAGRGLTGDPTDNSAPLAGAAYVFVRAQTTWTQRFYLKASNAEGGDLFGRAVSASAEGTAIAVAAHHEASAAPGVDGDQTDNSAGAAGAAYVFE